MEIRSPDIIDSNPAITIGNERIVRAFQDLLYRPAYPITKLQDYCRQIMHLFADSVETFQISYLYYTRFNRAGCFFDHVDALLVPPIENNAPDVFSAGTIDLITDREALLKTFSVGAMPRTTYHTLSTFEMKGSVVVLNLHRDLLNPVSGFMARVAATAAQLEQSRLLLHLFYQVARDFLGNALGIIYQAETDGSLHLLASPDCVKSARLQLACAQIYQCQCDEALTPRYRAAACSNKVIPDLLGNLMFDRLF